MVFHCFFSFMKKFSALRFHCINIWFEHSFASLVASVCQIFYELSNLILKQQLYSKYGLKSLGSLLFDWAFSICSCKNAEKLKNIPAKTSVLVAIIVLGAIEVRVAATCLYYFRLRPAKKKGSHLHKWCEIRSSALLCNY